MKIVKYKYLNNSRYKILFDNKEVILYEEVILKYSILTKKEVTDQELLLYLKENTFYEMYYEGLTYEKKKMRTRKEMYEYLKKIGNEKNALKIIDLFLKSNILNDNTYCICYINNAISLKMIGPNKIKKELLTLGIDEQIIDTNLKAFTSDLINNKIKKYIDKELRLNKKSSYEFKNKMIYNLISKGFSKEDIENNLDFTIDDSSLYQKEYDKLYKKLSVKYEGKELEYQLKQRLYAKGFRNN